MLEKTKKFIKRTMLVSLLSLLVLGVFLALFLLLHYNLKLQNTGNDLTIKIFIYVLLILFPIIIIFYIWTSLAQQKSKTKSINNGINYYMENLISSLSIGIIVFQPNGNVLWVSNFISERFGEKIINENIEFFNDDKNFKNNFVNFKKIFKYDEYVYKINFVAEEMILVLRDITQEYSATYFYESEKLVVGEIEIDNYQLFRSSFTDEQNFKIQRAVNDLLENLSKKYNLMHRQYMEGKFIILTNRENLNKMIAINFKDFEKINETKIEQSRLSLSIGFGADSTSYLELTEMAKTALYQSQTRGGDQITVISSIEKTKRYGSSAEIGVLKSKTKIKLVANNLKIKLQDKNVKNVIIYGHKFADLDALGASYALYEIAKSYDKNVFIQNVTFDETGKKAVNKYIKNPLDIFISKSKIKSFNKDNTLVIIVDCSEETRIENPEVFENVIRDNLFIFDHHRVSKLNDVVDTLNIYIESTASSASEIITELIQFNEFQQCISPLGAQMLLNGIYLDTNQFRKSASSRTFAAAALLEDMGASVEEALSILKISEETNNKIIEIISKSREIKPGFWLSYTNDIVPIDVISMAADEILKIEGRKAAFVIAQLPRTNMSNNPIYKLSARSVGVNVQLIAEAVGGGGHFDAAAAISDSAANETLDIFVDNIIQAIISSKV